MHTLKTLPVVAALLLSACSLLQSSPQPVPPVSPVPQEIQRNQTQGLQRIGTVSALARGAPSDGEAAIKAKAAAAGANYYVIVLNDETLLPGQWYAQAILYRQP